MSVRTLKIAFPNILPSCSTPRRMRRRAAASRPASCPQWPLALRRTEASSQDGVYPNEVTRCNVGLERAATTLAPRLPSVGGNGLRHPKAQQGENPLPEWETLPVLTLRRRKAAARYSTGWRGSIALFRRRLGGWRDFHDGQPHSQRRLPSCRRRFRHGTDCAPLSPSF